MKDQLHLFGLSLVVVLLVACDSDNDSSKSPAERSFQSVSPPATAWVDENRLANLEQQEPGAWLTYGRNYEEQRFSPLTQINLNSVSQLGIAWFKDFGTFHPMQATPLVIDGVMYITTPFNIVYALDAKTGKQLWRYDPEVPGETARRACCGVNARGLAAYKGRIYSATLDGRLIALNAATGKMAWEVDTLIDHERDYTITGAPRVAADKVFIGNGGAEFGVRGYVTAYDADTGEQAWRFFTVPGDPAKPFEHPEMKQAAETWKGGEWWKIGGGGTVWNSIVYDPDFHTVYLGVGNGSPWTRIIRSPGGGDNLFLAAIVALDPDNGKMKWYYQTTPGDNWDYTAVQDMMLADMEIDGKSRKVLMQAPKNGFFYVLDRQDGRLLRANQFATVTWATHVDMDTGRPVENPDTEYLKNPQWILPGPSGAHNWHAMSYDAGRRLVYFGSHDMPFLYAMADEYQKTGLLKRNVGTWNVGVERGRLQKMIRERGDEPIARGYLNAFDPVTGEKKWVVEQEAPWNGGVLATAGSLVFQGEAGGKLVAFDSDTGETRWQSDMYTSIVAPPISYAIDGEQYIALATGAGGGGPADQKYGSHARIVAFKLGGKEKLPVPTARDPMIPDPPPLTASTEEIERGEILYGNVCSNCHGPSAVSGGGIPDLRYSNPETHGAWPAIVLGGAKKATGMASFSDLLSATDAEQIHQFVIWRATEDRAEAAAAEAESG